MSQERNVDGVIIRNAIKVWKDRLGYYSSKFQDQLFAFQEETNKDPKNINSLIVTSENSLNSLQLLQERYNQHVTVSFKCLEGNTIHVSLAEAIKMVGTVGREEARWRTAATSISGAERRSYGYSAYSRVIKTEEKVETAEATISEEFAISTSEKLTDYKNRIIHAITEGNSRKIDLNSPAWNGFPSSLFGDK